MAPSWLGIGMPEDLTYVQTPVSLGALPPRARVQTNAETISLAGEWQFGYHARPADGTPAAFDPFLDDSAWDAIQVPAQWELNGYGSPTYLESRYPIPLDPPFVPDANPTGDYRKWVEIPAQWASGRILLRLDGVESGALVVVNGTAVGWTQGSRLTHEFDITAAVNPGERALMGLRVHSWSAGTYLEDQDTWRMSGVIRDVALVHRPEAGVQDVVVTADFDPATGLGTLNVQGSDGAAVRVAELGLEGVTGQTLTAQVEPWSAEAPRLYDVVVSTPGETVTLRVGFRRVEIADGLLMVNGRRVVFRGVNRHDFHPLRGRAVTETDVWQDLVLAKRYNINAIRTAHYPPIPAMLDMCDELGLYVVEECDLETHGFSDVGWQSNPVDDPWWSQAVLERLRRMVSRDRNHACVVMWSLGNESGAGQLLARMHDACHELDPSRPVHYENDRPLHRYSDVYSRMYATPDEVRLIGTHSEPVEEDLAQDAIRRAQPFVLCEYAHAMGTGPGALRTYEDLADTYPRIQGGFVWEMADQALWKDDAAGGFFAYGGDFGEPIHDGAFICDGLVKPDRTPGSGFVEVKAVFAPVAFHRGEDPRQVMVRNRRAFTSLDDLSLTWRVTVRGEVAAQGDVAHSGVGPATAVTYTIPEPPESAGAILTVSAHTKYETRWAPAGHEVARASWRLGPAQPITRRDAAVPVRLDDTRYVVGSARLDSAGTLRALGDLAVHDLELDVWRAPTDNDLASPHMAEWRSLLANIQHRRVAVEATSHGVVVTTRSVAPGRSLGLTTVLEWQAIDRRTVQCAVRITPDPGWKVPFPRMGLRLVLDTSIERVRWEGRGPGESYPDMKEGAPLGVYERELMQMQSHQARPQENGHRSEVQWCEFIGARSTFSVRADRAFGFTARPWSTAALEKARHREELVDSGRTYLTLDLAVHGLGSAACGPDVLPEHSCDPIPREVVLHLRVD